MTINKNELWLGLDMGSTTVKCVILDSETKEIHYSEYRRHDGAPLETVITLLSDINTEYPETQFRLSFTGSQCSEYAEWLDAPYIQEVIAGSIAVAHSFPETATSVELGGQDAKILFFNPEDTNAGVKDMRMNGVCAGGTGAFLDQIAALLHIPIEEFNEFASRGKTLYDISGRCGVFAKTDIQPLLNEGVPKEDIALSCFHALAKQTIGGLAQGMTIQKPVLFAGGPFFFMPKLVEVYKERLELSNNEFQTPENSQTFIAMGTALALDTALGKDKGTAAILEKSIAVLQEKKSSRVVTSSVEGTPFFESVEEKETFVAENAIPAFDPFIFPKNETIPVYIGIDGGSTTTKFVVIDDSGNVLYKFYESNRGEPVDTARKGLLQFHQYVQNQGGSIEVKGVGTTGYGENLFAKAFGADYHTVETIAHKEAAAFYEPDVSFILDLGGQDMKAIFVKDGVITDIILNEACSAGCGSFIESYSRSLSIAPQDIAPLAFESGHPSVLGSRCTVFMNSSIISEQKSGKSVGDILGGLCSSVIENLFTKVVRVPSESLGDHIVVQGGTFKNDAVLRAFSQYTGKTPIRPPHAGEMGALGIALLTKTHSRQWNHSHFIGFEALAALSYEASEGDNCPFCANACSRSIIRFSSGITYTTGHRCERGEIVDSVQETPKKRSKAANLMRERETYLYKKEKTDIEITRGTIGIPMVLDFYDSLPFWKTFFTELGYDVVLSGRSSSKVLENGLKSVPSDTVCLPAKVAHGHVKELLKKGVKTVFFPMVVKNLKTNKTADDSWNCAVLQGYPEVVRISDFSQPEFADMELLAPSFKWTSDRLKKNQVLSFAETLGIPKNESSAAFGKAVESQNDFQKFLTDRGKEIIESLEQNHQFGVVLSGRPYHGDSYINHGVADLFTSKEIPVLINEALPIDSIDVKESRIDLANSFHTRMMGTAHFVAENPSLEFVQLVSFGCGHDAVFTDELERILRSRSDKGVLALKLDEGENKGPLNIRITSFIETVRSRREMTKPVVRKTPDAYELKFGKEHKQRAILIPNLTLGFTTVLAKGVEAQGFRSLTIPYADRKTIDLGKKHLHNDICFPAQINVGEFLHWLVDNPERKDDVAILMAKSYNECRASHYTALARKALDANGFDSVPLVTTDFSDARNIHPGFKLNQAKFSVFYVQGIALTDALHDMRLKCRPYEEVIGSVDELYNHGVETVVDRLKTHGWKAALAELKKYIEKFNELKTDRSERRPRVGIIGEFLVNYHDTGNYNVIDYLEQNGMEVVLPHLIEFFRQETVNFEDMAARGHSRNALFRQVQSKAFKTLYCRHISAIDSAMKEFKYYEPHSDINEIAENAKSILDISYRSGEGWLIPGEILTWRGEGIKNFLIVQPFGCLPNHVSGRGIMKAIKERHPEITLLSLDFDPDTSLANIHNRLQMIILNATK